jgi:hypothetical protein
MVLDNIAKSTPLLTKENLSSDKQIKLWHLALLIGIPSATVAAYLYYRRYLKKDKSATKSIPKSDDKNVAKIGSNESTKNQKEAKNQVIYYFIPILMTTNKSKIRVKFVFRTKAH